VILTTEKDAVKLVGRWDDDGCRLLALVLEIAFRDDGDRILADAIDATIQPSAT
jgi:tetraacyldisaccharide-1-P 4'-kinase